MTTVNRLCVDLGIKHPFKRTTCIGYGKAKPTCGNAVAAASRSAALASLETICEAIADGTSPRRLRRDLEAVAHLLHCKRWHQPQAPAKAQEWEAKLRYSIAQRDKEQQQAQRQRHRSTQPPRESRRRTTSHRQTPQSAVPAFGSAQYERDLLEIQSQTRRVLSTVQSVLDNYQGSELRLTLSSPSLGTRSVSSRPHVSTDTDEASSSEEDSDSATESEDDDDSDSDSSESSESDSDSATESEDNDDSDSDSEASDLEDSTTRAPSASGSPAFRSSRITPIRPSPSESPSRQRGSTSSSSSSQQPSIVAPPASSSTSGSSSSSSSSGNECGICLSRLSGGRRNKWRCETCHNKVHIDCFNGWVASSPEGNVRCIYCRSTVRT